MGEQHDSVQVRLKERLGNIRPPAKAYFYRPAAIWMVWELIIGFLLLFLEIADPIYAAVAQDGKLAPALNSLPFNVAAMLVGIFMISHGTLMFLVATGYFVVLGDGGIWHLENLEAMNYGPVITSVETYHKKLKVRGKEVKVWKWGRLGGIRGVTQGGGPRNGYAAVVVARWFESLTEIVTEFVCRACGYFASDGAEEYCRKCGGRIIASMKQKVLDGYRPTDREMMEITQKLPGRVKANVLDIDLIPWETTTDSLPLALRLKVENDWKWKPDSPVQVMYDPIPRQEYRRDEQTPGSVVELWGYTKAFNDLTISHSALAKQYAKLQSTFTMQEQLRGGAG